MSAPAPEKQDERLNPSQQDYLRNFENTPGSGQFNTNRGEGSSQQAVAQDEKRAINDSAAGKAVVNTAGAAASVAGTPIAGTLVKALGRIKTKKGGIGALIVGLIIAAIILIGGFTGPGLLLVHFVETLTEKFDTQFASFDGRAGRMYVNKLSDQTNGLCTTTVSIKCRYSTMSTKEIDRFKKAGITVVYDDTSKVLGRAKPKAFEFSNPSGGSALRVDAANFKATYRSNPHFRLAIHNAANPRYIGYSDFIFKKVASHFNISKRRALSGETDAERAKSISDATRSGTYNADGTPLRVDENSTKPDGTPYTADEIAAINNAADFADQIAGGSVTPGKAFLQALSGLGNAVSITGWADTLCGIYGTIKAIGYAAKIIRTAQLVNYAWIFYNTASQIKDGTATPGDVAYLGGILTTVLRDTKGQVVKRAATDGWGYGYAARGDLVRMPNSTMQFMAGGGLSGDILGISSTINSALGGTPNKTCGFIRNPWVSGASLVAGIALMIIPGVNVVWSAKTIAVAAGSVAFELALAYLPALLQDVVAGKLIDPDNPPVGEDAGDAIVAGGAELAGQTAQFGGNSPLTIDQAVAYERERGLLTAAYAEEDRLARSPLDITSRYTMAGSIVAQFVPDIASLSSVAGTVNQFGSLLRRSIGRLAPTADAVTEEQYRASLDLCTDPEYNDLGSDGTNQRIATTPFCNVIYGMPPEWLDTPTFEPLNALEGQYNPEDGTPLAGSSYETFVTDCINRLTPLGGSADVDQQGSNGTECVASDTNKAYYLAWMDRRVGYAHDEESPEAVQQATVQQNPTVVVSGTWAKPYDNSTINSIYGGTYYRSQLGFNHMGVDLQNPMNSPVYSACDGTVLHIIRAGGEDYGQQTSSNAIVVDCGGGIWSGYHHTVPEVGVTEGMAVRARTLIGRSDCSGICSGAHLHFAIRINGAFTDPVPFMAERGVNLGTCRQGNPYCV